MIIGNQRKGTEVEKKLINAKCAAEILGIKEGTIYLWSEQGRLPSFKVGRCRRFDPDEILEWLRNPKRRGNEPE
jgi:excisionase family DNA binding protein